MSHALTKPELTKRLNRIAGQVAGVQRMVEEDRYCIDVLNQISAVRRALDNVGVALIRRHLESCVLGHGEAGEHAQAAALTREELLAEIESALDRLVRA